MKSRFPKCRIWNPSANRANSSSDRPLKGETPFKKAIRLSRRCLLFNMAVHIREKIESVSCVTVFLLPIIQNVISLFKEKIGKIGKIGDMGIFFHSNLGNNIHNRPKFEAICRERVSGRFPIMTTWRKQTASIRIRRIRKFGVYFDFFELFQNHNSQNE